jgi:hypothetical protein
LKPIPICEFFDRFRKIPNFGMIQVKVTLRLTVSKSWCRAPLITLWQLRYCFVGRPVWRENGSVFCICCWPLPAQSFSGPSPLGLATIFYCHIFETSFFVSYDSQGHCGGIWPCLHTGMTWSSLWIIFIASGRTEYMSQCLTVPLLFCFSFAAGMCLPKLCPAIDYSVFIRCRVNVLTELLPSNGHIRHNTFM